MTWWLCSYCNQWEMCTDATVNVEHRHDGRRIELERCNSVKHMWDLRRKRIGKGSVFASHS